MAFFNSKTPKRTSLWSNSKQIRKFWLGKLTKEVRQSLKKNNPDFKTTVTYVDSQGKKRFHGTKSLRSTQNLGFKKNQCVCWWALCFLWHIDNPRAFTVICNQGHILVNFLSRWPRTFCPTWRMNFNNLLPSAGNMQPRNSRPCGMRPKALATPGTMQSFGMWHDICWGQKAFVYHQNGNGLFHLICELRTMGLVQKRVIDLALAKYRSIIWWRMAIFLFQRAPKMDPTKSPKKVLKLEFLGKLMGLGGVHLADRWNRKIANEGGCNKAPYLRFGLCFTLPITLCSAKPWHDPFMG